jgi:hypothetical protein
MAAVQPEPWLRALTTTTTNDNNNKNNHPTQPFQQEKYNTK